MGKEQQPLMVSIRCMTYNQVDYIRDCLEGFVNQKTNFRFEAIVHDDASTDGTTVIVKEYAEKYPDIIKPIFEEENQYCKGTLRQIMNREMRGKYIALCEGDDYWIDPYKLQKQFDYMESHPECSLCFHANYKLYPTGRKKEFKPTIIKDKYTCEDIILGGGGFMATNSMFYRWDLYPKEMMPDFWKNSPVGDLPNMLYYSSKGDFGYIDEVMSVYRMTAIGSWSTRQSSFKIRRKHTKRVLHMFDEFDKYTNYEYHRAVKKKKRINIKRFWIGELLEPIRKLMSKMKVQG